MKRYLNTKNVIFILALLGIILCSNNLTFGKNNSFHLNHLNSFVLLQEDPYLPFAETMPEAVGGIEAIYKKLEYPALAKKAGIEGKVYLLVYVNESGEVDDVKVLKSVPGGCDEAAIKAVKSVKYTPGKNGGAPVKVKLSLCITFKIAK
jgi:protein TonB